MPMCKWLTGFFVAIAAVSLPHAITAAGGDATLTKSGRQPVQQLAAVLPPKMSGKASALELAAERGVLDAQLKLARKFVAGDGVPRNPAKAIHLYQRIVDDRAETRSGDKAASRVAYAFVALGNFYRTGIPGTSIKADKRRALSLIWHAASYLGDAEAQSNLAQMILEGEGISRNARLAISWLASAAKKRHAKSQALLGDLLWRGASDIRRQPLKGLALLVLARQNAGTKKEALWIDGLLTGAFEQSSVDEREKAEKLVAMWEPQIGQRDETPVVAEKVRPAYDNLTKLAPAPGNTGLTQAGLEGAQTQR